MPSSVLGSGGPVDFCGLVPGLPSGSAVVAPPASSVSGGVSLSGVSRPGLLVRCFGRRMGGASGLSRRFRPLGRVGVSSPYQRQGAACHPSGSPPLPVVSFGQDSSGLLRQCHCRGVSSQGRGHQVSFSQLHCTRDPALVGVSPHPSGSTIHPGLPQRPGGHSLVLISSRVQSGTSTWRSFCLCIVGGRSRSICLPPRRINAVRSIFLRSGTLSQRARTPFCSPGTVFRRMRFLCLQAYAFPLWSIISRVLASQAPGVSGDGAHASGSVLAAEALVSGPPPAVAGPSSGLPQPSRPPIPALVSSALPGYGFMPGDFPALHQSGRFLVRCSFAGFIGAPSIFAHQLPAQVVGLPFLVPFPWSFGISSDPF